MEKGKIESQIYHRRSIRITDFDYSQSGWYYVTICTFNGECLFGNVNKGMMMLNEVGKNVDRCWLNIPDHYPNANLHDYIIMPNHIHGIIEIINEDVGVQNLEPLQHRFQQIIPRSVGSIVRGFKVGVTKWIHKNTKVKNVWQRNYFEHIIRNEKDMFRIQNYIRENPLKWNEDKYYNG